MAVEREHLLERLRHLVLVPVGEIGNVLRIALRREYAEAVGGHGVQEADAADRNVMREVPRGARVVRGLVVLLRVGHGVDRLVGVHPFALEILADHFADRFRLIWFYRLLSY